MAHLSPEALESMRTHMNDDHGDAVIAYAKHFGGFDAVESATIVELDPLGITVELVASAGDARIRIPFDHEIVDTDDGRMTLVAMAIASK